MSSQIEVTRLAMISRLRRRVAKDGLILRMNRQRTRAYRKIGECAIIDPARHALVEGGGIAELAQKYELLASWEYIMPQPRRYIQSEVQP